MDNDLKKQKIATAVKYGLAAVAVILVAPMVFLLIQGIVGLALAAILALAVVNFAPVLSMKFANWKVQGLKAEARANPIETRENIALQNRERLQKASQELTTFAAEVRNFATEVKQLAVTQPDDADDFNDQLNKLQQLLELKRDKLRSAEQEATAFEEATKRAARKWKVAQSAIRMQKLAGVSMEDEMNKLLASESLDSVETAMNRAMAELDTALLATVTHTLPHKAQTFDVTAIEITEKVAR